LTTSVKKYKKNLNLKPSLSSPFLAAAAPPVGFSFFFLLSPVFSPFPAAHKTPLLIRFFASSRRPGAWLLPLQPDSLPHTRPSWPLQLKQPVFSSKNRDRPATEDFPSPSPAGSNIFFFPHRPAGVFPSPAAAVPFQPALLYLPSPIAGSLSTDPAAAPSLPPRAAAAALSNKANHRRATSLDSSTKRSGSPRCLLLLRFPSTPAPQGHRSRAVPHLLRPTAPASTSGSFLPQPPNSLQRQQPTQQRPQTSNPWSCRRSPELKERETQRQRKNRSADLQI